MPCIMHFFKVIIFRLLLRSLLFSGVALLKLLTKISKFKECFNDNELL